MPILDVDCIGTVPPDLAQRLAGAVGTVLGTGEGQTWVRLRRLPPTDYAENGPQDIDSAPLFLTLLLAAWPPAEEIEALLRRVTEAAAAVSGLSPARVHVQLAPPAAGRQAFGGRLVH